MTLLPGEGFQDRGLARPVGANERDDMPRLYGDLDAIYHRHAAVAHRQVFCIEQRVTHRPALPVAGA